MASNRLVQLRLQNLEPREVPANIISVQNTNDSGPGSLRDAILNANSDPADNIIVFVIGSGFADSGVKTIDLTSQLPAITGTTTIDGYSQPGAVPNSLDVGNNARMRIVLNRSSGTYSTGILVSNAANCVIRGLVLTNFSTGPGAIKVEGTSDGTVIAGNWVGVDATGQLDRGNGEGITVQSGVRSVTIGGDEPQDRNVIGGNERGIVIRDGASSILVQGNYVGTNAQGTSGLGNNFDGVRIEQNSRVVTIKNNVISGNQNHGVYAPDTVTSFVTVQDNLIGLAADGSGALLNSADGISSRADSMTVFGNSFAAQNSSSNIPFDLNDDSVTNNDPGDSDTGPNDLENFPDGFNAIVPGGNVVTLAGTFVGQPNQDYNLYFYLNRSGTIRPLKSVVTGLGIISEVNKLFVTTDSQGVANLLNRQLIANDNLLPGDRIQATAELALSARTSELSSAVIANFTPEVNLPASLPTATENQQLSFTVPVDNPESPSESLGFTLLNGPQGATIDGNGVIRWVPAFGVREGTFTVQVSDNASSTTSTFKINVNPGQTPPQVSVPANTIEVVRGQIIEFQASASDADGDPNLRFSLSGQVRQGMSIDPVNGFFRYESSLTDEEPNYAIQINATDSTNRTSSTNINFVMSNNRLRPDGTLLISLTNGNDTFSFTPVTFGGVSFLRSLLGNKTYIDDVPLASISGIDLFAGDGNDVVTYRESLGKPVALRGGAGNDRLTVVADVRLPGILASLLGGSGNDTLTGGKGDDQLNGGTGNDSLVGGAGTNTLDGGEDNDILVGGPVFDFLLGGAGRDTLLGNAGDDSIVGGPDADLMRGGPGNDEIFGEAGNDTIQGEAGNDFLGGNEGDDSLVGGIGNDDIDGGDGKDTLQGDAGNDLLVGGSGDDRLRDTSGNDILSGGDGADQLIDFHGRNVLIGGRGRDTISGGSGEDLMFGGFTTNDEPAEFLFLVFEPWFNTQTTYINRVSTLRPGFVPIARNDGEVDILTGGAGLDWFLLDGNDTVSLPLVPAEFQDLITAT